MPDPLPHRQIRAHFDRESIVLYQAYNDAIADAALAAGKFVEPFSTSRATWIKPSFLWLMERSGWATKSNQTRILAVRMTRAGWEEALNAAVLTHPDGDEELWEDRMQAAPVLVQWDPERSLRGEKLSHRSIQVGLRRQIVERFVEEWVVDIKDLTALTRKIARHRKAGEYDKASRLLPSERPYPLTQELRQRLGAD